MRNKLLTLLLLFFCSILPSLAQTAVYNDNNNDDNDTTAVADSAWTDSLIHRNDTLAWPKNVDRDRTVAQERHVPDFTSWNDGL